MIIDDKTRKKLIEALRGTNYRKVVSERADVHPNTVANILREAPSIATAKTERVETELLLFVKEVLEVKQSDAARNDSKRKKALAFAKQL